MNGEFETRRNIATNRDELMYEVPAVCTVQGLEIPGDIQVHIHFGTDSILASQSEHQRTARKIQDIAEGHDVPDAQFYLHQIVHGRYGPITGHTERFSSESYGRLALDILQHMEYAFASRAVYDMVHPPTIWHRILRPKGRNLHTPILFHWASNDSPNGTPHAISGALPEPGNHTIIWDFKLNYYHSSLWISRTILTGVMDQQLANETIMTHEQLSPDVRVSGFAEGVHRITGGSMSVSMKPEAGADTLLLT